MTKHRKSKAGRALVASQLPIVRGGMVTATSNAHGYQPVYTDDGYVSVMSNPLYSGDA